MEQLSRNESSESLISSPSYSQKSAPHSEEISDDCQPRPRSNTLSEIKDLAKDGDDKCLNRSDSLATHHSRSANKKPLLNIFMKVGSQTKLNFSSNEDLPQTETTKKRPPSPPSGSWRQAIFNRIHMASNSSSPDDKKTSDRNSNSSNAKSYELNELPKKKTREELRQLWKSAIKQQMILNKMERQNKRLQG